MINITDEKGKNLGLEYDYEYRGSRREKYRDMPYYKSHVVWFVLSAVFVLAGVLILIKELSAGNLPVALLCFALSGLFIWFLLKIRKKHRQLLEAIEKQ